jgi:hypothetical protein
MTEVFTAHELTMLRQELMSNSMDSRDSAELLQVFLAGRGYGVSPCAAMDAGIRLGTCSCSLDAIQRELSRIALVQ